MVDLRMSVLAIAMILVLGVLGAIGLPAYVLVETQQVHLLAPLT